MSGPRSKRLLLGKGHARKKSSGCPLTALILFPLLPLLLIVGLAMAAAGRHRAPEQPARPDEHPDRLGAHEKSAHRRDQIPADQLTRRDTSEKR